MSNECYRWRIYHPVVRYIVSELILREHLVHSEVVIFVAASVPIGFFAFRDHWLCFIYAPQKILHIKTNLC